MDVREGHRLVLIGVELIDATTASLGDTTTRCLGCRAVEDATINCFCFLLAVGGPVETSFGFLLGKICVGGC